MDNYKIPTTVLIDLSKAFDTLNHDILLSKLRYYGVSGVELRLLSNYLSDRVQYIEYLGAISKYGVSDPHYGHRCQILPG